ncbi:MAG: hypothetical protein AB7V25_13565, partial [Mangrovibacterium sp.]
MAHLYSGSEPLQSVCLLGSQHQHYCGRAACQQVRKDKWERERSRSDPAYLAKRKLAKKNWYR